MNYYPAWKNLMIAAVVAIGLLFALPNVFGQDPSLELNLLDQNKSLDETSLEQIKTTLANHNIDYKRVELEDKRIRIRFADSASQLKAKETLEPELNDYVIALNLSADVPGWLQAFGAKPMNLGLDLRGGIHVLIDVDIETAVQNTLRDAATAIRTELREEKLYGTIRSTATEISVSFKKEAERDDAERLIEDSLPDYDVMTKQQSSDYLVIARLSQQGLREAKNFAIEQNMTTLRNRVNQLGVSEPIVQRQGERRIVVELPGVQDPGRVKEILQATATLEYRLVDTEHNPEVAEKGRVPFGSELYYNRQKEPVLLYKERIVTGDSIVNASSGIDSQSGTPAVFITLDGRGGDKMRKVTTENINKPMAVVFIEDRIIGKDKDGRSIKEHVEEVINVATIRDAFGRNFQTTGLDSLQEAKDLALFLRSGALRAPIDIVEERTVGPSLGQDNIDQGFISVVIGLLLVMLFMAFYYRVFGLIANLVLVINLVLIVAVLSMLQATLTLPGIAGIVLTVGMAVDANVLIFERIREELRMGNSPQASIGTGYAKALSTIVDANITTLIAAVLLFSFGTGPIKGFAVTLFIGILTSMFTSILGTRAIVNYLYGGKSLKTLPIGAMRLLGADPRFNFMSKRYLALILSGIVLIGSITLMSMRGLNFGIDFTGGTLIEIGYQEDVELEPIRQILDEMGHKGATVQQFGTPRDILIRVPPKAELSSKMLSNEIFDVLKEKSDKDIDLRRVEYVGPQVGEELTEDGGMAMLYAMIAILIYVALRFEWRFAVGSIIALIHDVIFTLGLFGLIWMVFDLPVLAAILAVIGYSLNDTIVVYDRIRENFRRIRKGTSTEIINVSLNQTLSRTLVTSLTTSLVLLALFFLGGEIIHGFATALLAGVVVGTYSSVFVASVSVLLLGISKEDMMQVKKEEILDSMP